MRIAAAIGSRLKGGEVIELNSDVGGGKTTFVRGLAKGMGSSDKVASPSFTISKEYKADALTLYHFDFYRLDDPGIMTQELAELVGDPHVVIVVEWGGIVEEVLPIERLIIRINNQDDEARELAFSYPESLQYLIPRET